MWLASWSCWYTRRKSWDLRCSATPNLFPPSTLIPKKSYLGLNVVKTRRRNNAEANEENVGLRVAERAQAVVVLLTRGIPKTQADGLVVDHDARRVVVEHGRDVLAGEGVGGVGDEQTGLADGTVAGDDALQRLRSWGGHCRRGGRVCVFVFVAGRSRARDTALSLGVCYAMRSPGDGRRGRDGCDYREGSSTIRYAEDLLQSSNSCVAKPQTRATRYGGTCRSTSLHEASKSKLRVPVREGITGSFGRVRSVGVGSCSPG